MNYDDESSGVREFGRKPHHFTDYFVTANQLLQLSIPLPGFPYRLRFRIQVTIILTMHSPILSKSIVFPVSSTCALESTTDSSDIQSRLNTSRSKSSLLYPPTHIELSILFNCLWYLNDHDAQVEMILQFLSPEHFRCVSSSDAKSSL
jgi:hypothetical protein